MEKEYKVVWRIEVYADTPEEAARQAREILLDRDNIASVFEVAHDDQTNMIDVLEIEDF